MLYLDITKLRNELQDTKVLSLLTKKVEREVEDNKKQVCIVTEEALWLPSRVPYKLSTPESLMIDYLRDDDEGGVVGGAFNEMVTITAGGLERDARDDAETVDTDVDFLVSKEEPDNNPPIKPTSERLAERGIEVNDSTITRLIQQQLTAYSQLIPNNLPTTLTEKQYLPCLFFTLFNSIKAFMLNHGTGVGKTVQGSFVAHSFLNLSPASRVIILVLGVTRSQWEEQLKRDDMFNDHMGRIDIVAYDRTTFGNNLNLARMKLKSKDRVLVIIDEIHIMISRSVPNITGGERTMKTYLDTLLELTRRGTNKLLLLTGTPFTNSIKEFELYLNIFRPNIFKSIGPSAIMTGGVIKRVSELTKMLGLSISSLNPQTKFAFSNTEATDDYASKRVIFKRVVMHSYQEALYKVAEEVEKKSSAAGFRYLTRNYGNFAYKVYVRDDMTIEEYELKRADAIREFVAVMRSSSAQDREQLMEQCSAEFKSIVDHIAKEQSEGLGMKCVLYINMMENIDAMKAYLDARDITYFEFSGRTLNTRQDDITKYNHPDNLYGAITRVMILSSAGSIGINIFGARRLYFLSQEWTNSLSQQIIGRCLRYRYHVDFPVDERELRVYLYFSVIKSQTSTDDSIFELMKRKYNLLSQALEIMIEASVESDQHQIKLLEGVDINPDIDVLNAINNYLDRRFYSSLGQQLIKEKIVRKIVYRYHDKTEVLDGFLSDNNIYTSNMILVTSAENAKVMIDAGKMIYVIQPQ